ncbi:hypothetical protein HYZ80_01420 [Candidatus Parcubacteria bacterium]|nr:hypothetical protein [Candidatus Parcubacteria bacterium]
MKCPICGTGNELVFSAVETVFEVPVNGQRIRFKLPVKYWVCAAGHPCLPARGYEEYREWPVEPVCPGLVPAAA